MKGFGFFTMFYLALALILFTHMGELRESNETVSASNGESAALARMGTLRNIICSSFERTDESTEGAWRLAVQTTLAEQYGMLVSIDGDNVTLIDAETGTTSSFFLNH